MIVPTVLEYAKSLIEEAHGDLNMAIYLLSCRTATRLYDCGGSGALDIVSRNNATVRALIELDAQEAKKKRPVEIDLTRAPQLLRFRADDRLSQLVDEMRKK